MFAHTDKATDYFIVDFTEIILNPFQCFFLDDGAPLSYGPTAKHQIVFSEETTSLSESVKNFVVL